jgi:hypothetical protein
MTRKQKICTHPKTEESSNAVYVGSDPVLGEILKKITTYFLYPQIDIEKNAKYNLRVFKKYEPFACSQKLNFPKHDYL